VIAVKGGGSTPFILRLMPGEDLRGSLEALVREQGLQAAYVASCVGSLKVAAIRFADAPAATKVEGPFEIVGLSGTLSRDGPHLHIALSDRDGKTIGGHLGLGSIIHTTAEIVVVALEDIEFSRKKDERTGYSELLVSGFPPARE